MVTQALVSVLAAAGSGSSSFGGGGGGGSSFGGGGSSFGGGGSSFGSGGTGGTGSALFALVLVALVILFFLFVVLRTAVAHQRYMHKRRQRVKEVRRASAEAGEDDAWFASEAVATDAAALFAAVQGAWDRRDREQLSKLVGADLMVEWNRRLDDFDAKGWHNRVSIISGPEIEYVGLTNREQDTEDRCVVRIEARLRDVVDTTHGRVLTHAGQQSEEVELCEYWTLARTNGGWIVASIEQRSEGDHHLDADIVASPWGDTQRLHDEAIVEGAVADKVAPGFTVSDIAAVDFEGDARQQALDLSLADGRFAPAVLEAAARRAVAAWVEAVDGADAALLEIATPEAVRELLYGGDEAQRTRVVIRGAGIERVAITAVDAHAQPAQMTVAVEVSGVRYVEDRDTAAVVSGDKDDARGFRERWTLALDGPDDAPWRIVGTQGHVTA